MTIREFAKLNNFPIKGKLTRIPDEVEYDFNDQPHNCKRYVDEDFNESGMPALPEDVLCEAGAADRLRDTHLEQEDSLHVADKLNEYLSGKSENSAKSSQKVVKLAI